MYDDALAEIGRLWDEGRVETPTHLRKRMHRRRLDLTDVQHAIRHGRIMERNRPRPPRPWRYRVEGPSVDGAPLTCIVAIDGDTLVIVTIYGPEEESS